EKNLGSISDMSRLPAALFVVDTTREHIAVAEALKLNIPIFAMVDTNSDPRVIDYVIPSNDDDSKSIESIMGFVYEDINEEVSERKSGNDDDNHEKEGTAKKAKATKKDKEAAKVTAAVDATDENDGEVTEKTKKSVKKETVKEEE